MEKITHEEYLQSLQIVKDYQNQILNDLKEVKLTPIRHYVLNVDCSIRLKNVLIIIESGNHHLCREDFIENIKIKEMRRIRGCGQKSILEFINLRGY